MPPNLLMVHFPHLPNGEKRSICLIEELRFNKLGKIFRRRPDMEKLFSIATYYYYFKIPPRYRKCFFPYCLCEFFILSRKSELCFKCPSSFSHSSLYYSPSVTTHLNQLHFPHFPSVFSVVPGGYYPSLSVTFTLLLENTEEDTTWAVHRLVESKS